MQNAEYDVIIVGAGPAGAAATLYAQRSGLQVLLVDRSDFPRDKTCGDALSGKTVDVLKDLGLIDQVRLLPGAPISRIIFGSPDGSELVINLNHSELNQIPEGFVIRREVFDRFMFDQAIEAAADVKTGFSVTDLVVEDGFVRGIKGRQAGSSEMQTHSAPIVLGADGYNSIVARKTGLYSHDSGHMVVALRQYFQDVGGLTDQIELHFIDEVIPGYFWMFPLEDGKANVGIGMLHRAIKKQGTDLRQALANAIASPRFRDRFRDARPLEDPIGWNLPVGSKHYPAVGDGFMLLGDAAGLIDPFTGEGIGNALYSARYAIETAAAALQADDFSASFLARYDKALWKAIGPELRISSQLQKIGRRRWLLNFVIARAARKKRLGNLIAGMITNEVPRQQLANPLFYLRLLFS